MTDTVTVAGEWLAACGLGDKDKTFRVIREFETSARNGSGFERMYVVDRDGYHWTVALCRLAGYLDSIDADGGVSTP